MIQRRAASRASETKLAIEYEAIAPSPSISFVFSAVRL